MIWNRLKWFIFAFLAIAIGLYPLFYTLELSQNGLLSSKSEALLSARFWFTAFYFHIGFGGLSLLVGWSQFSKKIREKYTALHRNLGRVYIISVLLSGITSLYIGYYATGGFISQSGFIMLGITWLFTTVMAFYHIRKRNFEQHEYFMIYSYAACFAAVMLRIYLPILSGLYGEFIPAYRTVAWLCWVPNIIVAYFIVHARKNQRLVENPA